jgi:hypothetical protein
MCVTNGKKLSVSLPTVAVRQPRLYEYGGQSNNEDAPAVQNHARMVRFFRSQNAAVSSMKFQLNPESHHKERHHA